MHGIPERMKKKLKNCENVGVENEDEKEEKNGQKIPSEDEEEEKEEGEDEDEDEEEEEESPSSAEKGYVAISLYYLDGPLNNIQLKAQVNNI